MGGISSKSKDSSPKQLVIFGATGAQGGSVVRALQGDNAFKVRAVTRNPDSDKAKALAEQGVEVVAGNLDDADSLNNATQGAHGVFAVTNYWEILDKEKEIQQGKNIADACKANNVKHVVFSSLENVKEATGKECPHFDTKAEIEAYMRSIGLPLSCVRYSFYCENLLTLMKPQKGDDEVYTIGLPMEGVVMDMVPVAETGECIHQIFKKGKKFLGKSVGLSSHKATIAEYAEIMGKHLEGKTFKAGEVTAEQFAQAGFPGAEDMAAMFAYYQTLKLVRDVTLTKSLNPHISDFDKWVEKNKDAFNAALE